MTGNDQATTEHLTPKQELLIESLLAGHTIASSAKVAGVSDKTARRWLKLEHFQRGYRTAQRTIFDQALSGLLLKVEKAIETLDNAMSNEASPYSTRVRAAQILLEQSIAVYKAGEVEDRIAELEQLLKGSTRSV